MCNTLLHIRFVSGFILLNCFTFNLFASTMSESSNPPQSPDPSKSSNPSESSVSESQDGSPQAETVSDSSVNSSVNSVTRNMNTSPVLGKMRSSFTSKMDSLHNKAQNKVSDLNTKLFALSQQADDTVKESIINDALSCMFIELPKFVQQLDALQEEVHNIERKNSSSKWNQSDVLAKYTVHPNYKECLLTDYRSKYPPKLIPKEECSETVASEDTGDYLLAKMCANHLHPECPAVLKDGNRTLLVSEHECSNAYSFPNCFHLMPPTCNAIAPNEEMIQFADKLKHLFVDLNQMFFKINLGFNLMWPKFEANDDGKNSLRALDKIMQSNDNEGASKFSSLLSIVHLHSFLLVGLNLFEILLLKRVEAIKLVTMYPHFMDSHRYMFNFDSFLWNLLERFTQNLIGQYCSMHDLFVKNFEHIIKLDHGSDAGSSPCTNLYS